MKRLQIHYRSHRFGSFFLYKADQKRKPVLKPGEVISAVGDTDSALYCVRVRMIEGEGMAENCERYISSANDLDNLHSVWKGNTKKCNIFRGAYNDLRLFRIKYVKPFCNFVSKPHFFKEIKINTSMDVYSVIREDGRIAGSSKRTKDTS